MPTSPHLDPGTLLSTFAFAHTEKAGQYVAPAVVRKSATIVLVTFDASRYPLEQHCRFAFHTGGNRPYTFPNFEFREKPPGLWVGPWPGWRGIPPMPGVTVMLGETERSLQFQFWGDELDQKVLRAVVKVDSLAGEHILVSVTDHRLVPLEAHFYSVPTFKPTPCPFSIPAGLLRNHPRLLISDREWEEAKASQSPQRQSILDVLRGFRSVWSRTLEVTPESKLPDGPELLSPEDRLLIGAFLARTEDSPSATQQGIKALLDYCALTEHSDFAPLTIDTQSGETLFLMCIGYDWLFPHLDPKQEARVRTRLWEIADVCWGHLGYERDDYAQAHYLGCGMGLLAFSLLFHDAHPRAQEWAQHLAGVLKLVLSALPDDGFFPHGINLWIYEHGFLLRWLELLRSVGMDLWPEAHMALRNASAFRAAATSSDGLYGVTFGDPQFRVGGDSWHHYLIAGRTGSGKARSLGDALLHLPVAGVDFRNAPARRRVYEYLWFPDPVEPESSPEGSTVFEDGLQIFTRKGDFLVTFRSGPPLGRKRLQAGITGGYGHSDPCAGSFMVWDGDMPLISGPGPVYRRDTSLQNIITIDGKGQLGDSTVWMPDFVPPSFHAPRAEVRRLNDAIALSVDLASAYLPHLGLRSLRRSVLVVPGRFVLGADIVKIANPANIEWNLHSAGEFLPAKERMGLRFDIIAPHRRWTLLVSSSGKASWDTGLADFVPAYPNDGTRNRYLRVAGRADATAFHWCLCLTDDGPELHMRNAGRAQWQFQDGLAIDFDGTWFSPGREP